jgi:hypothetical protein
MLCWLRHLLDPCFDASALLCSLSSELDPSFSYIIMFIVCSHHQKIEKE